MDVTVSRMTAIGWLTFCAAWATNGACSSLSCLKLGPRRFNDLKRSIPGISQRMLTLTLRNLERDGFVERTVTPSIPPHVSYGLTDLGQSLSVPVRALCAWSLANIDAIDAARERFEPCLSG